MCVHYTRGRFSTAHNKRLRQRTCLHFSQQTKNKKVIESQVENKIQTMSKRHLIIDTRIASRPLSLLSRSFLLRLVLSFSLYLFVSFFSSSMPSGGKATLHRVAAKSSSVFLFQFCKMQFRYLVCCIASSSSPLPPPYSGHPLPSHCSPVSVSYNCALVR